MGLETNPGVSPRRIFTLLPLLDRKLRLLSWLKSCLSEAGSPHSRAAGTRDCCSEFWACPGWRKRLSFCSRVLSLLNPIYTVSLALRQSHCNKNTDFCRRNLCLKIGVAQPREYTQKAPTAPVETITRKVDFNSSWLQQGVACSSRGSRFKCQHPHAHNLLLASVGPGQSCDWCKDTYTGNTQHKTIT